MSSKLLDFNHPVGFLRKLSEKIPENTKFSFEAYKRVNKSYDQGHIGGIVGNATALEMTDSWPEVQQFFETMLQSTCSQFGSDYEIGLRSKTDTDGHLINVPMIDFIGNPDRQRLVELIEALSVIVGKEYFWLYNSGRSLHAYVETLISPLQLKRFYEAARHFPDIVDIRWIEYSISRGYALLRWSNISTHHNHTPIFLEKIKCA